MLDRTTRRAVETLVNGKGRSHDHILKGLALTAGAVLLSSAIASRRAPTPINPKVRREFDAMKTPDFQPSKANFIALWPPLFLALTLSGLRIWNAPPSQARRRALGLWSTIQVLNAVWMGLGPRRLSGQVAAGLAAFAAALGYAWQARKVDPMAANMVAPYLGVASFANVVTEELWRNNPGHRGLLH